MRKPNKAKKKAAKKSPKAGKKLLVTMVLDETSSMSSCRDATISGFNEYITGLQKRKDKIRFTLTKFNTDKVNVVHEDVPVEQVTKLSYENYSPAACTNLYDAIGRTIHATEAKLAKEKTAVLFVIMTDGEENSSKEYTREKIYDLIKKKEKDGWQFAYLGANQDAWQASANIGLDKGNAVNYVSSDRGTKVAFASLNHNTRCYADAGMRQTNNFFMGVKSLSEDESELQSSTKTKS